MDSFRSERGSRFGSALQRNGWLLPLIVGIGIGALLFGLNTHFWDYGAGPRARSAPAARMFDQRDRGAPQAEAGVVPQQADPRDNSGLPGFSKERHDGRRGGGFAFFPFAPLRLIIPLLLIGAGAWLVARPRGGGGGSTMPASQPRQPDAPYTMPSSPADHNPTSTTDPPSTGDTQRL